MKYGDGWRKPTRQLGVRFVKSIREFVP